MKENKGFILPLAKAIPAGGGSEVKVLDKKGKIKILKNKGTGNPNLQVYPLLRPATVTYKAGKEPSKNLWVTWKKCSQGAVWMSITTNLAREYRFTTLLYT